MSNCCPEKTEIPAEQEGFSSAPEGADCCPPKPGVTDCCPPPASTTSCCPPPAQPEIAGYSIYPFVSGWLDTPVGMVPQVVSSLNWSDLRGRWAMRWGLGRNHYRVTPGLYAVGTPDETSPLLVSANYKLSFDCLRSALKAENAWLLVIDTQGVNVWCAAGKGTFGTEEIIRRCKQANVEQLVGHRQLIVPQLGAPGVAAYKVKQETGFKVIYGPVRATDLQAFLAAGMQATEVMRKVTFTLWERLILTPVEVTILSKQIVIAMLILFILSGIGSDIFSFSAAWQRGIAAVVVGLSGVITGCVLTPVLLPWLPGRAFSVKGALLGLITATVLALGPFQSAGITGQITLYLTVIAVASYTAMNFTGSSTFTSPSGVEKEMRFAIPCQALALLTAGLLWITAAF